MIQIRWFFNLLALLVVVVQSAQAGGIQVVAKIGSHAEGFADEFVYWNVGTPSIGRGGHIAFTATADTGTYSTAQNTDAVWAGFPGHLHVVIKEGETISGLPSNVLFSSAGSIVVTPKGSVAFYAKLSGAVTANRSDQVVLTEIEGVVQPVLRLGEHAPGFDVGVNVSGFSSLAFTDAGMVIVGQANNIPAIWFWDGQEISLIAASGEAAGTSFPGCNYYLLPTYTALNQSGEIGFKATMTSSDDEAVCPSQVILRWKSGQLSKIVEYDEQVPGMTEGIVFNNLQFIMAPRIDDAGDLSFTATIRTPSFTSAVTAWVAHANGNIELGAMQGEAIPGDENSTFTGFYNIPLSVSGNIAFAGAYYSGFGVFAGTPRANPYTDLTQLGASPLSSLAVVNGLPPGFEPTWYFDDIGSPLMNNQGNVVFHGIVKDASDPYNSATTGLWLGNAIDGLHLLAADGMEVEDNGEVHYLSSITALTDDFGSRMEGLTTNTGWPNRISDTGQVIFNGTVANTLNGYPEVKAIVLAQICDNEAVVDDVLKTLKITSGLKPDGGTVSALDKNANRKVDMVDALAQFRGRLCGTQSGM